MKNKKTLLFIAVIIAITALISYEPPGNVGFGLTNVATYDMSTLVGADTTIYRKIGYKQSLTWSTEIRWATLTGAGTIALYVSNDGTNWYAYNSSPNKAVSGASGDYEFEDDIFGWEYLGWKLTKGTISVGTLTVNVNVKKP